MKKIAFHSNQLGLRGVEVSMYDYAHYNEIILNNKSFILADKNKDMSALKKFQDRFDVFLYNNFNECLNYVRQQNIQGVYFQKAGDNDGKIIPGIQNYIHAVFQERQPHGDKYAYISKWLANQMNMPDAYVPYIVDLPNPIKNYRTKLGLKPEQIVIGRHGGYNEFDLPFVYTAIYKILEFRSDLVFLFMNTKRFGPRHPNIIFIESTFDLQNKSNFINTCDFMIHARHRGESFGLAISEFLFHDKPVISWAGGVDQNHVDMLTHKGMWYKSENDLFLLFKYLQKNNKPENYYKEIVNEFTPGLVMQKFKKVFFDKK